MTQHGVTGRMYIQCWHLVSPRQGVAHVQVDLQARAQEDDGEGGAADLLGPAGLEAGNDDAGAHVTQKHTRQDHAERARDVQLRRIQRCVSKCRVACMFRMAWAQHRLTFSTR